MHYVELGQWPLRMLAEPHQHTEANLWISDTKYVQTGIHTLRRSQNSLTRSHSSGDSFKDWGFFCFRYAVSFSLSSKMKELTNYKGWSLAIIWWIHEQTYCFKRLGAMKHHICWAPPNLHVQNKLKDLFCVLSNLNIPKNILPLWRGTFLKH